MVDDISRRAILRLGVAAATGMAVSACGANINATEIATDAYVFGYPLVLMDATRVASGAVNQFSHNESFPTPADRLVVRMNLDTLYSQAWLDLRFEPLVLQLPAIESGRYWLIQMLDAWTNTVHNPSSVRPGPTTTYLLTGPGWTGSVPTGMTRLEFPTPTVWVIVRVQVNGLDDIAAGRAIQRGLKLAPLRAWQADPESADPGITMDAARRKANPVADVAAMDGPTFFTRLCAAMAANPPMSADQPVMQRFANLGITPGGKPTAETEALNNAVRDAKQQIAAYRSGRARIATGWSYATDLGTYGINYPLRATTARNALGANLPEDALYPSRTATAGKYRLRFPTGQLPPVDAFWSLTAYDADGFLIANPANIYAVGHQIPITINPDGTTDITIQNADPGPAVPRGNWLPIPASGEFSLTLRLYAPKSEAVQGRWQPPTLDTVS